MKQKGHKVELSHNKGFTLLSRPKWVEQMDLSECSIQGYTEEDVRPPEPTETAERKVSFRRPSLALDFLRSSDKF